MTAVKEKESDEENYTPSVSSRSGLWQNNSTTLRRTDELSTQRIYYFNADFSVNFQ